MGPSPVILQFAALIQLRDFIRQGAPKRRNTETPRLEMGIGDLEISIDKVVVSLQKC